MFYSMEEFEAQMQELLAKGVSDSEAYDIVRKREQEDADIYQTYNTGGEICEAFGLTAE